MLMSIRYCHFIISYFLTSKRDSAIQAKPLNTFYNSRKYYFNFPYSSSETASHHSLDVSSPGTSTAR